jgi:hypothetical protein
LDNTFFSIGYLIIKAKLIMAINHLVISCASNSFKHRHEKQFLEWIDNVVSDYVEELGMDYDNRDDDSDNYDERFSWDAEEWRDNIIDGHELITDVMLAKFEELLLDSFTEVGEEIASVGYDHYGMGHSGWNGVYEFCGMYLLQVINMNC